MVIKLLAGFHVLVFLVACTPSPARHSDERANELGFERAVVPGNRFQHVVYRNQVSARSGVLHVYLEGDGSPWIRERWISSDPGPRKPLMLQLMALDSEASVYLGRPCYHGFSEQRPCHPAMWTYGRYSMPVIDAMAQALDIIVRDQGFRHCVLIGYSGGGTIAMLLAERVSNVLAVVTIAGNLDPDEWARHHEYSPLSTSLNPTRRPPLPARIYQLHVAAGNDDTVPPEMSKAAAIHQQNAELRIIPDYDHVCCWHELWPSILTEVTEKIENAVTQLE